MIEVKKFLLFLWLLPATIAMWVCYIVPLILFRQLSLVSLRNYVAVFSVRKDDNWYVRRWRDWGGWGGPCVILLRYDVMELPVEHFTPLLRHEVRHCYQQFLLGPFFYPAYALSTLWILAFRPDEHSYHDNPFEKDARRYAGQKVDIPREEWMQGPEDRFPWL